MVNLNSTPGVAIVVLLLITFIAISSAYITYIEPRVPLKGERPKPGTPWPLPRKWTKSSDVMSINPQEFYIETDLKNCDVLTQAIQRYQKLIFGDSKKLAPLYRLPEPQLSGLMVEIHNQSASCGYPEHGDDESYEININRTTGLGKLCSNTVWGSLRGLETLSQLIWLDPTTRIHVINETKIEDCPTYSYRGLLIDTARHFIPVEVLLSNLDAMAYNKMNVFHWHLVDDQSFPFESRRFPKLTELGAYTPKHIYPQSAVKKIIEYARLRGIRVIPEIDSPGHTKSYGRAYPWLLTPCYGEGPNKPFTANYTSFSESEVLNPINNQTYEFMTELFKELRGLFPDSYVHLGMDEVWYGCWNSNPEIQAFMKKNGMNGTNQLEQYYVQKTIKNVKDIGYKYMMWQDPIDNGVKASPDTIVEVWKDTHLDPSMDKWENYIVPITQQGYQVVVSAPWYLNYINYPYPGNDWEKYYECNPKAFNGTQAEKDLVIGGEACIWSEFVDATNLLSRL